MIQTTWLVRDDLLQQQTRRNRGQRLLRRRRRRGTGGVLVVVGLMEIHDRNGRRGVVVCGSHLGQESGRRITRTRTYGGPRKPGSSGWPGGRAAANEPTPVGRKASTSALTNNKAPERQEVLHHANF